MPSQPDQDFEQLLAQLEDELIQQTNALSVLQPIIFQLVDTPHERFCSHTLLQLLASTFGTEYGAIFKIINGKMGAVAVIGLTETEVIDLQDDHGNVKPLSQFSSTKDKYKLSSEWAAPIVTRSMEKLGLIRLFRHEQSLPSADQRQLLEICARFLAQIFFIHGENELASGDHIPLKQKAHLCGTLCSILGHDLGNSTLSTRLRLESLKKSDIPSRCVSELNALSGAVDDTRARTAALRSFSFDVNNPAMGGPSELRAWWRDSETLLHDLLPEGVTIEPIFPEQIWVAASRGALSQALLELLLEVCGLLPPQSGRKITIGANGNDTKVELFVKADCPATRIESPLTRMLIGELGGNFVFDPDPMSGFQIVLRLARALPIGTGQGRLAVVSLSDKRLAAIASAELKALGYQVEVNDQLLSQADFVVVENLPDNIQSGAQIVVQNSCPRIAPHIFSLDGSTSPAKLREALKRLTTGGM